MNKNIIHIKSITQLLQFYGLKTSINNLITIIDLEKISFDEEMLGLRITSDLYYILLKETSLDFEYGINSYDFSEGVLSFSAPNQVYTVTKVQKLSEVKGWMLCFHPDLLRNTNLGEQIDNFNFINYEVNEALYLSKKEKSVICDLVKFIENEINEQIDNHSQQVIVSTIELILSYSQRFYDRQFNTRSVNNSDIVSKVVSLLKDYYKNNELIESGQPTIKYLADNCYLSPNYLSDLLSKQTGQSAKDHINNFLVHKAKHLLVSTDKTISEIAYSLGFNYPHYFGRLFKKKTGKTPQEFRQMN